MANVDDRPKTTQNQTNPSRASKLRTRADLTGSTMTTTALDTIHRAHPTSLASVSPDETDRFLKLEENIRKQPLIFIRDRNLLVAQRLALKRQRAAVKAPSLQFHPVRSDSYQLELSTADEEKFLSDQQDQTNAITPGLSDLKDEVNRAATHSLRTTPFRGDTPHTVPTDISVRYREKPLLYHPVTGQLLGNPNEDNGNPSPCAYVLPRKPCREKNAPAFTFGTRCLVEKRGGARTAWQKQWFAHSNPFTTKVDFNRETNWPTPFHYSAPASVGFQSTKLNSPAWSMAGRLETNAVLTVENNPGPDSYDTNGALRKLTAKSIPITLKSRHGGTKISTQPLIENTPGPGAHNDQKFLSNRISAPKHSFGKRFPISLRQDPYINVIPINRT